MAVNHADGVALGTVLAGPFVAGHAGSVSGAGWLSVLLVPIGIVAGALTGLAVRRLAHAILRYGLAHEGQWTDRPARIAYFFLPHFVGCSCLAATWFGCYWLGARMA